MKARPKRARSVERVLIGITIRCCVSLVLPFVPEPSKRCPNESPFSPSAIPSSASSPWSSHTSTPVAIR